MANYGSPAGVGANVPRWAGTDNAFADTSEPTYTQVVTWLEEASRMIDSIMAQAGFTVPVTDADVVKAIDGFANSLVAERVEGTKGEGRFGRRNDGWKGTQSRYRIMLDDVRAFVAANAFGFEQMGAERGGDIAGQMSFREFDESGDEVSPIFQREAFGNTFRDWD